MRIDWVFSDSGGYLAKRTPDGWTLVLDCGCEGLYDETGAIVVGIKCEEHS